MASVDSIITLRFRLPKFNVLAAPLIKSVTLSTMRNQPYLRGNNYTLTKPLGYVLAVSAEPWSWGVPRANGPHFTRCTSTMCPRCLHHRHCQCEL